MTALLRAIPPCAGPPPARAVFCDRPAALNCALATLIAGQAVAGARI